MFPRQKCCALAAPASACAGADDIPASATAPSTRRLHTTDTPPTTLLTANATASATLSPTGNGWQELALEVTPSAPAWAALLIVWFDNHTNLDPRDIGSITALSASARLRAKTATTHGLPLAVGIALEQNGETYISLPSRLQLPDTPNPCCWYSATATSKDYSPCGDPFTRFFDVPTHHPKPINRSTETTTVLSGGPTLCPDNFGTFDPTNAHIDRNNRPNLDVGIDPHPVARWGYVIGFTNWPQIEETEPTDYTPETHSLAATLGPICGTITSPGMAAYSDPNGFNPPGQLVLDESLANGLPAGWQTNDDLWFDDDASKPETGRGGGIFTARDGATFVENSTTVDKEFATAVAYIDLPNIPPPPYSEDFALTVEFTWRRISEAKRRYDNAEGWQPLNLNSQRNGIFIGGTARCLLGHQITAERQGYGISHGSIIQWQQPVEDLGGFSTNGRHYPTGDIPYGWPCPCANLPPNIDCPANGTGNFCNNNTQGYANTCASASPEDGDRVTYQLRRNLDPFALGELDPDWAAHRYLPRVWINGREVHFGTIGLFGWIWISNPLRIGLVAYQGGGWSDLKTWFNP